MRRLIPSLALVAWTVLASAAPPILATPEPAAEPTLLSREKLAPAIDAYLAPFLADGLVSGQLLVARGAEVLYEGAFGLANHELEVPVRPETRFGIASVTKPMTVIVAVRLIEAGKLALDDKLEKYLPGFPRGGEITVEHLLRHRAGIPHRLAPESAEAQPRTAADMVELARAAEIQFEPGSRSSYSSGGYSVLARVLELAGGKSFEALLDEHVFGPAGMRASLHPSPGRLVPQRASSYVWTPEGVLPTPLKHLSFLVGAGSVFSTARDLHALVLALEEGRLGESAERNAIGDDGLSWNGATNGYRAFVDYDRASGRIVVFASNVQTGAGDRLRRDLPRIARGEEVPPPERIEVATVDVPPAKLAAIQGSYELRPGRPLEVELRNGNLFAGSYLLLPTSEKTFFSPQDFAEVTVVYAEDGSIEGFDWDFGGDEPLRMPRLGPLER